MSKETKVKTPCKPGTMPHQEDLTMSDLLDQLSRQKQQLAEEKKTRYLRAKEKHENGLRIKRYYNPIFKHEKAWNPSIKAENTALKTEAWEPNPKGKEFDFDNKSLWPTFPESRSRTEILMLRKKKPWYRVRSGQLFNKIEYNVGEPSSGFGGRKRKSKLKLESPTKTSRVESWNSSRAIHEFPWRASDSATGRTFENYIADPPYTGEFADRITRIKERTMPNFKI